MTTTTTVMKTIEVISDDDYNYNSDENYTENDDVELLELLWFITIS